MQHRSASSANPPAFWRAGSGTAAPRKKGVRSRRRTPRGQLRHEYEADGGPARTSSRLPKGSGELGYSDTRLLARQAVRRALRTV